MTETILANATLILPEAEIRGSLYLADGHIARIVSDSAEVPPGAVDCQGDLVMPGLIELHTDNLERHIEPRPGVDWPHDAAILAHDAELAGAGITTVFDAMRIGSIPADVDADSGKTDFRKYARALASEVLALCEREALRISHFLHLRAEICSETLVEEMTEFGPEDRVGIVSLMDHTPGQRQFRDISKLEAYVRGRRGLSAEQFERHIAGLTDLRARNGDRHAAETVAFAGRIGAVLASHDDTTAEHVHASAAQGVRLAEFPTTTEAAQACQESGIAIMIGAPNLIRGGSHSGNVAAADLARDGLLDIMSSDYVPAGLLNAALRLGALWNDLPRGIRTVTTAPARAVGLADRGRLAEGLRADIIRVRAPKGQTASPAGTWVKGKRVA